MSERISREELVRIYDIEINFFDSLEEAGLLNPATENEIKYLSYDELPAFERFANLHYDLDVNLPGLEVLNHLLEKLETLQNENNQLRKYALKMRDLDDKIL